MFFDYLSSRSPIPLISIVDALAEALKRDHVRVVGLLGTKFTLRSRFYVEGLRRHGIEALVPSDEGVDVVNEVIYKELVRGVVRAESRARVVDVIKELVSRGAQAVALACTELPILISGEACGVKLYDTARIHAIKALDYALSK